MALDSLEKRRNVPGVGRPWMRAKHPVATPDQQWRIASGNAYGGNALAASTNDPDTDAGLFFAGQQQPVIEPFVTIPY